MLKTFSCLPFLMVPLAGLIAAPAAHAQDFDDVRLGSAIREGGRAGGLVVNGPAYQGSNDRRTSVLPLIEYRWASGWFAGVGSGVGYEFLHDSASNAGVRLTPDAGRRESRSSALAGMGNISAKPEIGLYANHALLTPGLALHADVRYGAGGDGLLAELGVAYGIPLAPTLRLRLGASATAANSAYMQKFFGVSDAQSVTSGYAPYEAKDGVRDTKVSASLLYGITPKLALTASLAATTLRDSAANSPLTRDRNSVSVIGTLTYAF